MAFFDRLLGTADKAWGQSAQVRKDRPEELLGHFGWTHFVRMRKSVACRRRGSAPAGKRPRVEPQSIANIIEADAVGELREEQSHDMAPRCKGSGFLSHLGGASNLGNQKLRNQIANLPQQIQF